MKDYNEAIVKIKTISDTGDIKLFTGTFYDPYYTNISNFNSSFNLNNYTFIITSKHCIKDDNIQNLELNYYFNNTLNIKIFELSDYDLIEDPDTDLCIIKILKNIYHNYNHRIINSDIYRESSLDILNYIVSIPGFYNEDINIPIYENANLCSKYSKNLFYIKSQYITDGYSGAPVFIKLLTNPNEYVTLVVGFVSKKLDNDNIEITSAENIEVIEKLIKRKPKYIK